MVEKASCRRDVKKAWLGIKTIINMGDCSPAEMKQLQEAEKEFYNNLIKPTVQEVDNEEVLRRRTMYDNSADLREILSLLWFVVSQERDPLSNELTKSGYINFNIRCQRALVGDDLTDDEVMKFAEADYLSDIVSYGPMGEVAFCDVVLELLDVWAGVAGEFFRSAFAWALFDCIMNYSSYPPRYKAVEYIKPMSETPEKELLKRYSQGIRTRIKINRWINFVKNKRFGPETFKRLIGRKDAVQLSQSMADTLAIVGAQGAAIAKLQGGNSDADSHDIYRPNDDSRLTLKNTVRSMLSFLPTHKSKSPAFLRAMSSEVDKLDSGDSPASDDNTSPKVARFPVKSVRQNMFKNSKGKDLLSLTIAANLLYEGETERRQNFLNKRSVSSVSGFLNNILPLVRQDTGSNILNKSDNPNSTNENGKDSSTAERDIVVKKTEITNGTGGVKVRKKRKSDKVSVKVNVRQGGGPISEVGLSTKPTDKPTAKSTARLITSRGKVDLPALQPSLYTYDDVLLEDSCEFDRFENDPDGTSRRLSSRRSEIVHVKDLHIEKEVKPLLRRRNIPSGRGVSSNDWKYELSDELSMDSEDSSFFESLTASGLMVTLKPKSRYGGTKKVSECPSTYFKTSVIEESDEIQDNLDKKNSSNLMDIFQKYEDELEMKQLSDDSGSSSPSVSTASSYSFMKRLHAPSNPVPTSAMEKKYAMKEEMKMVASQVSEALGVSHLPLLKRPPIQLYNKDGTARRVMSHKFRDDSDDVSLKSTNSYHTDDPSQCSLFSPISSRGDVDGFSRESRSSKTQKSGVMLPVIRQGVVPLKKGKVIACPTSVLKPLRPAPMNDSDLDTLGDEEIFLNEDTRSTFSSSLLEKSWLLDYDEKKSQGDVLEDFDDDLDASLGSSIADGLSWMRDMPRYLQDTGKIKPETLRTMSKSIRLGNFVVDESLDLKEY